MINSRRETVDSISGKSIESHSISPVVDNPGQKTSPKKVNKEEYVIGILTTNRLYSGRIKPFGVQGELSFLSRMGRRIPGKVYVFHPWDIDWKNNRFTGYRFHVEDGGFGHWERSPMPPPDVVYDQIYNRIGERRYLQDRTRLKKLTKGRYFNPSYLNKNRVHDNLKKVPEVCNHLPQAKLLKKPEDIKSILASYQSLYQTGYWQPWPRNYPGHPRIGPLCI